MKVNTAAIPIVNTLTADSKARLVNDVESNKPLPIADVYHKENDQQPPSTYRRPVIVGKAQTLIEEPEQTSARLNEAYSQLYFNGDMFKAADKLADQYNQFMHELASDAPQLAEKDWGFSVNESGAIAVSGQLSEDEVSYLEEKLNANKTLVQFANEVKDSFLKFTELERGPSKNATSQYWGKYDVNEKNFSDLVDMRSLMEEQKSFEQSNYSIGENLNLFGFIDNMGAQLSAKAQATYAE
ncbi:hypothetical protein J8L98_07555 [Pseudoalteromonas sp. MMG013]|uniref:hypothetical protein n=1 Tax=Pseudoalteromonas sp. MMG013 TaxID=2822687 RepID=UPI001B38D616|nr:hypothetical protein [Pseudoalteromonas sp. MMG013]MBQ4861543.1 hypothetical protein [Pseudoalteromonas sp. MMG013]